VPITGPLLQEKALVFHKEFNEGDSDFTADRTSHSEGLNSIKTALAYAEQQREATAADVLLFRRWQDLDT
jgi:hypothetical protein